MGEPFLSEIRMFSFNYPPKGWAFCNGQLLPINQNQALFSLLGTTYGGNGQTNFALPNLRGCVPIHASQSHKLGEKAGASSVTITQQTMPQHIHFVQGSQTQGDRSNPRPFNAPTVYAADPGNAYGPPNNLVTLNPAMVSSVGGSQPHNNMMPYLALSFCIALQGVFPSPN